MNWSVRISRQSGATIEAEEWDAVVAADPSREAISVLVGRDPATNREVEIPAPHGAAWGGHPLGVPVTFTFKAGSVVVRLADEHALAKAQSVASQLNALVESRPFD